MQVDVADNGQFSTTVTISYGPDEVRARRETVLKRLSSEVSLKGFRPGKSSRAVIEKRYGETATAQAEDELTQEGLSKAVRDKGLKPIGAIRDEGRTRDQGLRVKVAFETKPPVKLPDPKSLTIDAPAIAVDAAQVDETLTTYAKRLGSMSDVADSETLIADDAVTFKGQVTVGGEVAREANDFQHLLGAYPLFGKPAEDILALLAGKAVGATLSFQTELPATFRPEQFASKQADVQLTVEKAQRLRPAAIDDEFAKKVGATDVADLRKRVEDGLKRQKESEQHQKQVEQVQEQLLARAEVELPPKLLETLTSERKQALVNEGKDAAEADTLARDDAAKTLKRFLVLDAAADVHQVKVTREDLESQIQLAAARSGRPPQELAKRLQDSGRMNDVLQEIREAKALEVILELALGRTRGDQTKGEDLCTADHVHGPECQHGHAHG